MAKTIKEHEEICNLRYQALEDRLTSVESKIDGIRREIDDFKNFIVKLAFKSGLSIFVVVCGAVFVIKM